MKKLKISHQEAHVVKAKYGLSKSKKQKEILAAIEPSINDLVKEIRRMIRYHEERSGSQAKIGQVITMGGGANMPGLSEHLTSAMRIPVRMCDPWEKLVFDKLQPPSSLEKSMYITVAGLSLIEPKELFV
jgi:Tfp pilus assembly PilM family ATPase